MIPLAIKQMLPSFQSIPSLHLTCDWYIELLGPGGILEQSERVAWGFAKRKGQNRNKGYLDEAMAEAAFIVTYLIMTEYDAICEKYPDVEERHKFFRCTVGYQLKSYFSFRSTSTVSYLKKKGIEIKRHAVHEAMLVQYVSAFDIYVCLEDICKDEHDMRILEFHCMGHTPAEIGIKCGLSEKRVKKTLKIVRHRLEMAKKKEA